AHRRLQVPGWAAPRSPLLFSGPNRFKRSRKMYRRMALIALPVIAVAALILFRRPPAEPLTQLAAAGVVHVVKSPTCGCCSAWVDYMRSEGFTVTVEDREQPFTDLKRANGITSELESCHTAFIDGLAIEGHVPADLI